ncbi:cytochrome c biogenesis CcdA family protein [Sciscionella marina]|uniref:cytochrome c biogenesis CcdA family protein n=1 Tax=Sciscionella marina TaxID=508770 RepID=UPI00036A313E|nr:cytochrome c biogenesis protein CcdA [Sciscionella marina]
MTTGLLALALGAGLLAPINPCGFAVLPAFLAYVLGSEQEPRGTAVRVLGGLRAGAALTVGFAGTFTVLGVLLALGMRSLVGVVPWLAVLVGAVLAVVGLAMLAGWQLSVRLPTGSAAPKRGRRGLVAFGAGYAVASASCTLAVLLAVITQALASSNLAGVLVVFAAYAAGSATLLLTLSVGAAFASDLLTRVVRRVLPYASRIAGAVLVLSGGYLVAYWLPPLLTGGNPSQSVLTTVTAALSQWISGHQFAVALTALVLLAVATTAALVSRTRRTPSPGEDCCAAASSADETARDEQDAHPR